MKEINIKFRNRIKFDDILRCTSYRKWLFFNHRCSKVRISDT
jgi:hypothetical protein